MSGTAGHKPPYRNASLSVEERVEDLLQRMTLEEKVGQMFHTMIIMGPNGTLTDANPQFHVESTSFYVSQRHLTHFNLLGPLNDVRTVVEWHNRLQTLAASTRLGIPITVSTDPRHHFTHNIGTAFLSKIFSQWPETLGFAALRSPDLVRRFADIARQEYLATGFRCSLHPQVDLATEPRWSRIGATFGEDADLSGDLVEAYIEGFQQGRTVGPQSVSTMTKHFPGGGAQKDGEDPHFDYGREQVYPGNNFDYHLRPFKRAIQAGTSQMMPYYGMPVGTEYEEVGFSFSKGIITGLLREKLGFDGIVCTDWALVTDASIMGQDLPARAWGCEQLSPIERVRKIIQAGCDQLGGESCTDLVIQLVHAGEVSERRIDESVRRILREKFVLGLFEKSLLPVDEAALSIVGSQSFRDEGDLAQRRAYTLLSNAEQTLPLDTAKYRKVYVEGMDGTALSAHGFQVVPSPDEADIALLRLSAPYEKRPGGFEAMFHAGSLEFADDEKRRQAAIYRTVPTVVDMYLDRPAVFPEVVDRAAAVLASYGSTDDAFVDVVVGKVAPEGKLPFDLPRSMEAVKQSREDTPFDTNEPAFRFGYGLSY